MTAQGSPLHLQIDTFEDGRLSTPVHRAYSQIKVFCDKVWRRTLFSHRPILNFADNRILSSTFVATRAVQPVATCRQSPSISQLLSLWRHSHYDIWRLRRSQPPFSLWHHSHCDVIRYWAGHARRYGHEYVYVCVRTPYTAFNMWRFLSAHYSF